ncbi:MAG: hypothetical protein MZV65_52375 [Chromatiales bacterium]|nr:hypothetical protein [Chromatiales bacterium]
MLVIDCTTTGALAADGNGADAHRGALWRRDNGLFGMTVTGIASIWPRQPGRAGRGDGHSNNRFPRVPAAAYNS